MKKLTIPDINIFILKYVFNWRFWIAKLTQKSKIISKIIEKLLFEDDEIIIIPNTKKVKIENRIEINKEIEEVKSEFLPTEILKEAIKAADDIVIMNSCICRTSNNCKDYPKDIGCIFLGPASKKIPKHLCYEASAEEAIAHIDRADRAGLSHLIGENKIDSVWMNVHPKEELLTICNCCPCCCLWKVLPNLNSEISSKIEKLNGIEVKLNNDNCKLCKKCLENICYTNAIHLKDNKIYINENICVGCGICANTCEYNAISITYTDESINSVINRIKNLNNYIRD